MSGTSQVRARARSFVHAGSGLRFVLRSQPNARIQLALAAAVVAAGIALDVSRLEWCWLVAAIAGVLAAECLNTALESLADALAPDPHPLVGRAKDAAAGGVLLAAIGAALIGLLVLGPHLWTAVRGA